MRDKVLVMEGESDRGEEKRKTNTNDDHEADVFKSRKNGDVQQHTEYH